MLKNLGSEDYGIWVLINSILSLLIISNFGMGNAMIKLGAEYAGDEQMDMFNDLFGSVLSLSVFIAAGLNAVLLLAGPLFLPRSVLIISLMMGAITGLRTVNGIISGSYMAKQRYDLNSKLNMMFSLLTSIVFTGLVIVSSSLYTLVAALLISTILLTAINAAVAKRTVKDLRFTMNLNKANFRKITGYSLYSFTQLIITTLNAQADRLIVGALLGTKALGYYTVCMQLVLKLNEIPGVAGGFLFAKFSTLHAEGQASKIKELYYKALKIESLFVLVCGAILYFTAKPLLSLWIGAEFASQNVELFQLLVIAVSVGAIGVVPFYFLNGTGYIKLNTWVTLLTTSSSIVLYLVLIPYTGLIGTGIGRFSGIPLVLYSLYYIERRIMKRKYESRKGLAA